MLCSSSLIKNKKEVTVMVQNLMIFNKISFSLCLRIKLTFSLSLASLATVDPYREEKMKLVNSYYTHHLVLTTVNLTLATIPHNPHLQVILLIHRQPVAEHVACDYHISLVSIDSEAVHAEKLW